MRGFDTLILVSVATAGVIQVGSLTFKAPDTSRPFPPMGQSCCQYQVFPARDPSWSVLFPLEFHQTSVGEFEFPVAALGNGHDPAGPEDGFYPAAHPGASFEAVQEREASFALGNFTETQGSDDQGATAATGGPLGLPGSERRAAAVARSPIRFAGTIGDPPTSGLNSLPATDNLPRTTPSAQLPLLEAFTLPPDSPPLVGLPPGPNPPPPVFTGPPTPPGSDIPEPASIEVLVLALIGLTAARSARLP
jgi:hypothetical protein